MVNPHLGPTTEGYVQALEFAADVVHQEARWQTERAMNHIPGASLIRDRMILVENVFRNQIQGIKEESEGE
jgi:hypothetical protein